MKGIVLAGGSGTRLHPMTLASSKQLLPVYDKPMIYYPLSVLMLAGIQDILIISTPEDLPQFRRLLGSGEAWGMRFSYAEQPRPEGIAQAFLIADDLARRRPLRAGAGRQPDLRRTPVHVLPRRRHARRRGPPSSPTRCATRNATAWRVFDETGRATDIIEKPTDPPSPWAVIGLYFYDARVTEFARSVKPSWRGELEITDLNRLYLEEGTLHVERLGRGCAWLDAGTPDSLLQAGAFVQTIQSRQGLLVGSPEEVAYRMGFIDAAALHAHAKRLGKTELGRLLKDVADGIHA